MALFDKWEETKQELLEGLERGKATITDLLDNQRQYLIDTLPKFYLTDYEGNIVEEVRVLWRQQAERTWVELSTGGVEEDGTTWFGEVTGYWQGAEHDIARIERYDPILEMWYEETVKDSLVVQNLPRINRILFDMVRTVMPEMVARDIIGEDSVLS